MVSSAAETIGGCDENSPSSVFLAVALISLEVVLWGLINLLRSIIDETVGGGAEALARALAFVLVGVPIFLFHWLWAQHVSSRDEEEKNRQSASDLSLRGFDRHIDSSLSKPAGVH